jgi:hypothetical protein
MKKGPESLATKVIYPKQNLLLNYGYLSYKTAIFAVHNLLILFLCITRIMLANFVCIVKKSLTNYE